MKPIESKRISLDRKIVLRFPDFDGFATEYAGNLSMTGMFVRSKEPRMAGTPMSFELRLEHGVPLVRGSGWVVWSRSRRQGPDQPAGMGIEFTQLDRKSRRLVRWMILSQLPEGEEPFDVHAGTASAPATVRRLSQAAARQRRRAGVLTAVLIFLALGAFVYWEGFRESGDVGGSMPVGGPPGIRTPGDDSLAPGVGSESTAVTESSGASSVAEKSSKGSAPAPTRRLLKEPSPQERAAAVAAAEGLVRSWAAAWSDQAADRYLSHYASDFVPEGGLTQDQWRDLRRWRLAAPRSIRVAVTRLEARLLSEEEARVSFLQTYRSDSYADTVDKVLTLARSEDGWKIRREVTD